MADKLIIVESPAKANTIKKFLGGSTKVVASMGHIRDLPKSKLGVNIENDFEPEYINIRGKGDLIKSLKKDAKQAKKVYLATDPDREGEAIAWHLATILKDDNNKITRVTFNEITKGAVQKAIKDVVSVPVLGDGNLKDPEVAKKAVEDGILDYVGLAHQMLADPYWPKKVKAHHEEDIAPCVGCNECLLAGFSGKHYYCAVNPLCYAEKAYALPLPNGQKRNVLVIGGGPAGMMAAITAKRRGFDVDLYEKEDKLGGTLWPAGGPDFKADVLKLIKYLETQCQKLGVNIHLNTAITKDNLEGDYDKVILAAGSTPAMPPITGIDTTVLASDYLTHQATVGKKVVVIGAGLAGTEAACDIAGKDGDVTLVEMCPDILFTANHCLNNAQHLRKMVKDRGVKVEANAKVTNITPTSVTFERDGQTMTLECDTVLNAVGFRPNNQLEELLDEKYDEVAVIGDAVAPRKILTAIHEGYHAIRVME